MKSPAPTSLYCASLLNGRETPAPPTPASSTSAALASSSPDGAPLPTLPNWADLWRTLANPPRPREDVERGASNLPLTLAFQGAVSMEKEQFLDVDTKRWWLLERELDQTLDD